MDTAAASRVAVITQPAFEPEVWSSSGSSLWIGITIVWGRAALSPPEQRATTATIGLGDGEVRREEGTGVPGVEGVGPTVHIVAHDNQIGSPRPGPHVVRRERGRRSVLARLPARPTQERPADEQVD